MDVNGDMDADVDMGLLHSLFHTRNSGFGHTTGESESGLPPDHRGAPAGIQLTAQRAEGDVPSAVLMLLVSKEHRHPLSWILLCHS